MQTTETEIQSENIKVKVQRNPDCNITMVVIVSPSAVKAAHQKAVKVINKEVSIPGFRKGKAPESLIQQKFNQYVEDEWKNIILQTTFSEALLLTKIAPFTQKSIKRPELQELSLDNGATITYKYTAKPEIPSVDPKTINLKEIPQEALSQKDIENTLREIQLYHAIWHDVTDRPLQEGDYVELEITNLNNNTPIRADGRFHVAPGTMGKWMLEAIVGKNIGDSVEETSQQDEENPSEQFVSTRCKITIKKVMNPELPEADDELAAKVGLKTIEELNEKIPFELERQVKERYKEKMRLQLDDYLAEHYPFDLPKEMVEAEVTHQLAHQKSPHATLEEMAQLKSNIKSRVIRSLNLYFITEKLAQEFDIKVSQEELFKEIILRINSPENQHLLSLSDDPNEVRSRAYAELLMRKTKDHLISEAHIQ